MMKSLKQTLYFGLALLSFTTMSKVVASNLKLKNNLASVKAGLQIEFNQLEDTFHRHLVKYVGECPGNSWTGVAQNGDLRFLDQKITPAKKLKVDLVNQTSDKKITRKYYKPKLGSNDFNLTQLGNRDGKHNVDFTIYHSKTKKVMSRGSFVYHVTSSTETQTRRATWQRELYCASDRNDKISECKRVAARMVKHCNGRSTGIHKEDPTYKHPSQKKCP